MDKLKTYKEPHKVLLKSCEHRFHHRLNNRSENVHQLASKKERQMRGFKTSASAQRIISSLEVMFNLFKEGRYKNTAKEYREKLKEALTIFNGWVVSYHH